VVIRRRTRSQNVRRLHSTDGPAICCGPRYAHEPEQPASRAGTTRSEVVLGGRKVAIQRPRVKRWRSGQMMLRWVAAGILEAVKGFRRVKGYADMPLLVAALRGRDRQRKRWCLDR
jgi:hypothetical protein